MRIPASMRWIVVLVFLSVIARARPAAGSPIAYTDVTIFNAATTGLNTITFEGFAPANLFMFFDSPPGLTTAGVNFLANAPTNSLFVIDPDFLPPNFFLPSGQYLQNNSGDPGSGILVTLPAGITALGADVSGQNPPNSNFDLTVTLTDGGVFTFPFVLPTRPDLSFVGFTSDVPILTAQFTQFRADDVTNAVSLDNFRFGEAAAAAVPEPASFVLIGTGVVSLAARRRRQRHC
jgi:PEP-CTERM motif